MKPVHLVRTVSRSLITTMLASLILLLGMHARPVHASAWPTIGGAADFSTNVSQAYHFTNLVVNGTGGAIVNVTLTADNGHLSFGSTTGLSFDQDDDNKKIFHGTTTDVNAALQTLSYQAVQLGTDNITMTLGNSNDVFYPGNGHVYEFVNANVSWSTAKAAAEARTLGGVNGYLATFNDSSEEAYINPLLTGSGWAGASDAAVEGDWRWVTGPESGTLFYQGNGSATPAGHTVPGNFSDWSHGEPNNSGGIENCMQVYAGGTWNDLPCSSTLGYIVEYGSPGNLPVFNQTPDTKTMHATATSQTISVNNCDELIALDQSPYSNFNDVVLTKDIDCTGKTVAPLFQSNSFSATFDGQGHTISHVTINSPSDSNIGLISQTQGAIFKNLHLSHFTVTGSSEVGALVAYASSTNFDSVTIDSSQVTGDEYVGGLAGYVDWEDNHDHSLTNVTVNADVSGNYNVAGIAGYMYAYRGIMDIHNNAYKGTIADQSDTSSINNVGGLVGYLYADDSVTMNIHHNSMDGTIGIASSNASYIGGFIGQYYTEPFNNPSNLSLTDNYSHMNISAQDATYAGGIIGYVEYDGSSSIDALVTIQNAYSSGDIVASTNVGGIVGYVSQLYGQSNLTLRNVFAASALVSQDPSTTHAVVGYEDHGSYWMTYENVYYANKPADSLDCSSEAAMTAGCTAIDTTAHPSYFLMNHTNHPMDSWDFDTIWRINKNTYPTFYVTDDGDGVSNAIESAAPNNGDANNDGIPDSQEDNVTSAVSPVSHQYVVLESTHCTANNNVSISPESALAAKDASNYQYPSGLLTFTLTGCPVGGTESVVEYYYGDFDPASIVVRKYNAAKKTYTTIPNAVLSSVKIGGKNALKVVYAVTDGGSLDSDGSANGTIVDPAGPAVLAAKAPNTGLAIVHAMDAVFLLVAGGALLVMRVKTHKNDLG